MAFRCSFHVSVDHVRLLRSEKPWAKIKALCQAWGAYQSSQGEELDALSQTLGLLSEETFQTTLRKATAVLEPLRRSLPSTLSLLQMSDLVDLALRRGLAAISASTEPG